MGCQGSNLGRLCIGPTVLSLWPCSCSPFNSNPLFHFTLKHQSILSWPFTNSCKPSKISITHWIKIHTNSQSSLISPSHIFLHALLIQSKGVSLTHCWVSPSKNNKNKNSKLIFWQFYHLNVTPETLYGILSHNLYQRLSWYNVPEIWQFTDHCRAHFHSCKTTSVIFFA